MIRIRRKAGMLLTVPPSRQRNVQTLLFRGVHYREGSVFQIRKVCSQRNLWLTPMADHRWSNIAEDTGTNNA
jgi:hypothetical protein